MRQRHLTLLLTLPLLLSAGPATTPRTLDTDRLGRVEAAKAVYEGVMERIKRGGTWDTLEEIELRARWSKRLLFAQLVTASSKEARIAAARRHLERITDLQRSLHMHSRQNVGRTDLAAAHYHLSRARDAVVAVEADKPLSSLE